MLAQTSAATTSSDRLVSTANPKGPRFTVAMPQIWSPNAGELRPTRACRRRMRRAKRIRPCGAHSHQRW